MEEKPAVKGQDEEVMQKTEGKNQLMKQIFTFLALGCECQYFFK